MIKYIPKDTSIVFSEIPDEITLAVNISNCQNNCIGCHSAYLKQDIGSLLNFIAVDELMEKNKGITCFCFMGEGNDAERLKELILYIRSEYKGVKIGLYSGRESVNEDFFWNSLDYIKIGPYIEEYGPLNLKTTNQRLYKYVGNDANAVEVVNGIPRQHWTDITEKFWRKTV